MSLYTLWKWCCCLHNSRKPQHSTSPANKTYNLAGLAQHNNSFSIRHTRRELISIIVRVFPVNFWAICSTPAVSRKVIAATNSICQRPITPLLAVSNMLVNSFKTSPELYRVYKLFWSSRFWVSAPRTQPIPPPLLANKPSVTGQVSSVSQEPSPEILRQRENPSSWR